VLGAGVCAPLGTIYAPDFVGHIIPTSVDIYTGLAVWDDGLDGDADIVVARYTRASRFVNNGLRPPHFTASPVPSFLRERVFVVTGAFNTGDEYLDMVLVAEEAITYHAVLGALDYNDPTLLIDAKPRLISRPGRGGLAAQAVRLDGDHDLDLVVVSRESLYWLDSDGAVTTPSFHMHPIAIAPDAQGFSGVFVMDADGDGGWSACWVVGQAVSHSVTLGCMRLRLSRAVRRAIVLPCVSLWVYFLLGQATWTFFQLPEVVKLACT
jgi:hypothetical protein